MRKREQLYRNSTADSKSSTAALVHKLAALKIAELWAAGRKPDQGLLAVSAGMSAAAFRKVRREAGLPIGRQGRRDPDKWIVPAEIMAEPEPLAVNSTIRETNMRFLDRVAQKLKGSKPMQTPAFAPKSAPAPAPTVTSPVEQARAVGQVHMASVLERLENLEAAQARSNSAWRTAQRGNGASPPSTV
jgi:hypothetical protein